MTPSSLRVLHALHDYTLRHSAGPTLRHLGALLGASHVTTWAHVQTLIAGGYVARHPINGLQVVARKIPRPPMKFRVVGEVGTHGVEWRME